MFNFLGAIASLLPGYMEGRRAAIKDNWQDLQNYNNVQMGQLNNLFNEATMKNRINMMYDSDINSALQTESNAMNQKLRQLGFPQEVAANRLRGIYGPQQAWADQQAMQKAYALSGTPYPQMQPNIFPMYNPMFNPFTYMARPAVTNYTPYGLWGG